MKVKLFFGEEKFWHVNQDRSKFTKKWKLVSCFLRESNDLGNLIF